MTGAWNRLRIASREPSIDVVLSVLTPFAAYVPAEELGRFYAERTLLGREVLPEHVAAAVFALVGGDLTLTTGTIVPVDGGVPMAFLR